MDDGSSAVDRFSFGRCDGGYAHRVEVVVSFTILAIACALSMERIVAAWPFNTDDAYITLRYAKNWVEHGALLWNLDEPPVEGYTNFLFVVLGSAAIICGLDPIVSLKIVSVASLYGTVVVMFQLGRMWARPAIAAVGPLLLLHYDGEIWWAVSGLETAVYQFLCVLTLYLFSASEGRSRRSRQWLLILAGVFAFLVSLARFEGPILLVGIGAGLILWNMMDSRVSSLKVALTSGAATLRQYRPAILAFALPYAIYFLWRISFFDSLLPNSAKSKIGFEGTPLVLINKYLEFALPIVLLALAGLIVVKDKMMAAMAAFAALYFFILIGVDPIIGYFNRHFLTVHAVVLVMATACCGALFERFGSVLQSLPRAVAAFGLLAAASAFTLHAQASSEKLLSSISGNYAKRMANRTQAAIWLNANVGPSDYVALGDAGLIPFLFHGKIVDLFCLNSLECTSDFVRKDPAKFANLVMAKNPKIIFIHSWSPKLLQPRGQIFEALIATPDLNERYQLVFKAPAPELSYWVYMAKN